MQSQSPVRARAKSGSRPVLSLVLLALVIVGAAVGCGNSPDAKHAAGDSSPSKQPTSSQSDGGSTSGETRDAPPQVFGSKKLPQQKGDWRLDSVKVNDDGSGSFVGTAQVTYMGHDKEGGNNFFTITLFTGHQQVGVLTGGSIMVLPGRTATVQLVSQDKYKPGPYSYDFQSDL